MQIVTQDAVSLLGAERCLREAGLAAQALSNAAFGLHEQLVTPNDLARSIADLELRLDQLRLIAGTDLVDLHKVEALAQLQCRLRAKESRSLASTHL